MIAGLVARIFGTQFCIQLTLNHDSNNPTGYYKINGTEKCLKIEANSLDTAQYALGRYIRKNEVLLTPNNLDWIGLPLNSKNKFYLETNEKYPKAIRYYQNVCTESYSMAFWGWKRWERELDWMALNGFNTGLLSVGQEMHFLNALERGDSGISGEYIREKFFTGIPFSAWHRMGNLKRFGDGQSLESIISRSLLSKQIFNRMIELGIKPILPAFAGFVPDKYVDIYPELSFFQGPNWPSGQFNQTFTGLKYLDPTDPFSFSSFTEIGAKLIHSQKSFYGYKDGAVDYYADTFNEMSPPESENREVLSLFSKAVFEGINSADKLGKWFLQGWLFHSSKWFWQKDGNKLKYLSGVPEARLIVLDLMSEADPIFKENDGYHGRFFVWNMLNNFGGNYGMVGHVDSLVKLMDTFEEYKNHSNGKMIGFGYTPEGIGRNYFLVDLLVEIWGGNFGGVHQFISEYTKVRYGVQNSMGSRVYKLLVETVFNDTLGSYPAKTQVRSSMVSKPTLIFRATPDWYKTSDFGLIYDELISEDFKYKPINNYFWEFDKTEITRQALSLVSNRLHARLVQAYRIRDKRLLSQTTREMVALLKDMDSVVCGFMGANSGMYSGVNLSYFDRNSVFDSKFINPFSAELRFSDAEKVGQLWQAKNQVTLWGPVDYVGRNLVDYAAKQECGMVKEYYLPRWEVFFEEIGEFKLDHVKFINRIFQEVELPFTKSKNKISFSSSNFQNSSFYDIYNRWRYYLF